MYFRLGIVLAFLFPRASLGETDAQLLLAVNDQGDRLTDVELALRHVRDDLKALSDENKLLKEKLQTVAAVCSNCCQQCTTQSPTIQTKIEPTTSPTQNTSTTTSTPTSTVPTQAVSSIHVLTTNKQTPTTKSSASTPTTTRASTRTTTARRSTSQSTSSTTIPTTATTTQQPVFQDCEHAIAAGHPYGAIVNITTGSSGNAIPVYCDNDAEGAWIVIQRRVDGSQDFNQNWDTYKKGFGDLGGEFWLGNENIYQITSTTDYSLRIDMRDWAGNTRHAIYQHFRIENENNYYRLFVGSYSGDAGDSFHYPESYLLQHFQMPFSTPDRDDDQSFQKCADVLKSGWWFNDCYSSNLNGVYLNHQYGQRMMGENVGQPTMEGTGIEWYPYKRRQYSMKSVVMKIRQSSLSSGG